MVALKLTRRAILSAIPLALVGQTQSRIANPAPAKKKKPLPAVGEFTRLTDSVTENTIVRLTNPAFASHLTALGNDFVSVRERLLVFSSDRTGHSVPFQVDLRSGVLKQIADTANLDPRSLCLDQSQKSVYFLDGGNLCQAALGKAATKTLASEITWFRLARTGAIFAIRGDNLVVRDSGPDSWRTLAESATRCWPQPNGGGCLFARSSSEHESELWYITADGLNKRLLAVGRVRDPFWDTDGNSILFLRDVTNAAGAVLVEIHSKGLNNDPEKCISPTSQFACFAPNGNNTVFVGASRSRAQPNVVLLLRSPNREMTLCEHGSRHPDEVLPAFSPDSRRVYFESDHEGKAAVYSVSIEYLVEPTLES